MRDQVIRSGESRSVSVGEQDLHAGTISAAKYAAEMEMPLRATMAAGRALSRAAKRAFPALPLENVTPGGADFRGEARRGRVSFPAEVEDWWQRCRQSSTTETIEFIAVVSDDGLYIPDYSPAGPSALDGFGGHGGLA